MGSKKAKGSATKASNIVAELQHSYAMELETVINYLTNSVHLDGMLAMEIKQLLRADVQEELLHAQQLADRIKILGGKVPGSLALKFSQKSMQPPAQTTDVLAVINGVIDAENGAIAQYEKIIKMTDGADHVTQDLAITLKGDEEKHRRDFLGFKREFELRFGGKR